MAYLKYTGIDIGPRYKGDVSRIQKALRNNKDHPFYVSQSEAYTMWENYSESLCAGWLFLPDTDDEIREILIGEYSWDD